MTNPSAQKLRVLYLTKVFPYPPANAGDAVYSRGIIEALSEVCQLTVVCADIGSAERGLQAIDWRIVGRQRAGRAGSVISRWPLIAWKGATADYLGEVDRLLVQHWDVIVLDNIGLAHALPRAERYRQSHPSTQLVYISHEYEYPTRSSKYDSYKLSFLKRILSRLDLIKVRNSERNLIRNCDIVSVINRADLEPFRRISSARKYLPLVPGYGGTVIDDRKINVGTPRRILLLGGRQSEQKRQILLDWMDVSYVRLRNEGIEIVIAGDMDEGLRQRLVSQYPEALVLGFVEDLTELVMSARIGVVADTVGGGFKMRLLSHVFERLPIVGLRGSVSGLPTPEGEGWLGADSLDDLVEQVCRCIDDVDRLNALQERAFADCASAFSWRRGADDFVAAIGNGASDVLL